MRVADLSHEIQPGMATYPGLPGPSVEDHVSFDAYRDHYAPGTDFQIKSVSIVTSAGTHFDAPGHRFRDGADAADLSLDSCMEPPVAVVDSPAEGTIGCDLSPIPSSGKRSCSEPAGTIIGAPVCTERMSTRT